MSTEDDVKIIDAAAARMRALANLAEASWPSPWVYSERWSEVHHSGTDLGGYDRPYVSGADGWNADKHQAAWDPEVALSVATMLEDATFRFRADQRAYDDELARGKYPMWMPVLNKAALVLARTFLATAALAAPGAHDRDGE